MNNDTQFLASGHSLKKISSKISSLQATQKIKQHCYLSISGPGHSLKKISSKISSLQATKKIKQHCYLSISGLRPFFKKDFLQDF